nr:Protein Y105C5B.5 [Haemonchus contortus]
MKMISCSKVWSLTPFAAGSTIREMQPKEVEELLKPIYTKFDEFSKTGDADAAGKLYHDQAVVVEKGEKATFGREEIVKVLKEFFEKVGPHKFVTSNKAYQGTDDYLIAECNVEVHPEKGGDILKGKTLHIWKKQDGNWLLYHDEYEKL